MWIGKGRYKNLTYKTVYTVGEHKIQMPPLPDDPNEVYFINEEPENAYWDRDKVLKGYSDVWSKFVPYYTKVNQDASILDERGAYASLNHEDTEYLFATYEKEMNRRRNGVFMRVENEIMWVTGDMWFVLMWCKTKRPDKKGDYFDFRVFQLEFFYLIYHTDISEHILGLFISKPKKTGITNLVWLTFLNRITMTKNINLGNMNIDQDKGAKTFRDHFLYSFNGLPPAFKAQVKTKSEADGKITFGKSGGSKKGNASFNEYEDELGSSVLCVPAVSHAFDVDVFTILWYDEPPKYKSDFGEIYRSNSAGTSIQDYIVGKIYLTSYTPEDSGPSFMSSKQLFYDSELRTIKPGFTQTKSRLICYHIPAYKSWATSFDKYGRCNEKEAMAKIQAQRDAIKDKPKELQALIRQYANDKDEAWAVGGKGSVFDPMRIIELSKNLEARQRESPENLYTAGNLKWSNELWNINPKLRRRGEFCSVYFEPLTEAELLREDEYTLREYHPLPVDQRNMALRFGRDEAGNLLPPPVFLNTLGADPTSHAEASEVIEGSTNSYWVMNRYNEALDMAKQKVASKIFMYEYYARPESPDDSFDDLLKLIIYTGALSAVESNASTFATNLMSEGLGNYMLVNDLNGIPTIWKRWMGMTREPEKKFHLLKTVASGEKKKTLEEFVRLWKAYIRKPFPGGKDYGATIESERIFNDLGNLDIKESTRKFDTFMGSGWCLWCDEIYSNILMYEDENKPTLNEIGALLRAFA